MLVDIKAVESAQKILKDRYPDMVKIFFDDTKSYIEDIEFAAQSRRFSDAIRPAHTIKSSSLRMGALALSQCAYAMEMNLKENDVKNFDMFNLDLFIKDTENLRHIFEQTQHAFHT